MLDTVELQRIVKAKQRGGESLYVLLDGACRPGVFGLVFSLNGVESYLPLYFGTQYASVMEYGPILIRTRGDSDFFHWFMQEGPSIFAGILLFTKKPIQKLADQFREFLEIKMPNNSYSLFRFYDPRNTRRALHIMYPTERSSFCNAMSALYVPRMTAMGKVCWDDLIDMGAENG